MRGRRSFIVCVLLLSGFHLAQAEPPTISYLFPAGAQRGSTTTVTMDGTFTWPVKVWSPDIDISCQEKEGQLKISLPHDLNADRIWFRIYNDDGASTLYPFLVGSLPETDEVEPNPSPTESQDLSKTFAPPNDTHLTINGRLEKDHDVDCFSFHLAEGQTVVAALDANTAFGSPMDAILQIVDPDGSVLAENHDDVGLDPRLAFTATKTDKYVARLVAFPAKPDQTIRFRGGKSYVYRLTLSTQPYITHAIPLSATLGTTTLHELRGWNIPPNTFLQPRTMDAVVPAVSQDRTHYIRASGWRGHAKIDVVDFETLPYEVVTTEQTPLSIAPPIALTGCIHEPKHVDHFRLQLQRNRPYTIRLNSTSLHSHLAAHVKLADSNGKLATQSSVAAKVSDIVLDYTPKADGEYSLTVRDRYDHGGPRSFYRLTIQPTQSDFDLSVSADRFTLTSDTPLEIPITISRTNGELKAIEAIEIQAIDLPIGVTCEPVTSETKGDSSKKVTLKLTGTQASSGPFRIRGTAANGQTQFTTSPSIHQTRFEQLWLTSKKIESKTDSPQSKSPADMP